MDAAADKAEHPSLMCYPLGNSLCWRLGLLPRHCDCHEGRHGDFNSAPPLKRTLKHKTDGVEIFIRLHPDDNIQLEFLS